jgi:hypothetical protein
MSVFSPIGSSVPSSVNNEAELAPVSSLYMVKST